MAWASRVDGLAADPTTKGSQRQKTSVAEASHRDDVQCRAAWEDEVKEKDKLI